MTWKIEIDKVEGYVLQFRIKEQPDFVTRGNWSRVVSDRLLVMSSSYPEYRYGSGHDRDTLFVQGSDRRRDDRSLLMFKNEFFRVMMGLNTIDFVKLISNQPIRIELGG